MDKTNYRFFEPTIANNTVLRINAYGNFLTIFDYSASDKLEISIGGEPFEKIRSGVSIQLKQGDDFSYIDFKNDTGASVQVEFALTTGSITDKSISIAGELDCDISTDTLETPAKVTATAVAAAVSIAADTDQREIVIENHSANIVWLGDAAVDGAVTRGIRLLPTTKIVLSTSAAIYLHAPAGNSDLSYMRLTK